MLNSLLNFKSFTIKELQNALKNSQDDLKILTPNNFTEKDEQLTLSIGEHFRMDIQKGSENIYLKFETYNDENEAFTITIFSKEFHHKVKDLAKDILKQC